MFVDEGVYKMLGDFQDAQYNIVVWTLVDSDGARNGVPGVLISQGTPFFVIYATSPAQDRWSGLRQTVLPSTIMMNPWTQREIFQA